LYSICIPWRFFGFCFLTLVILYILYSIPTTPVWDSHVIDFFFFSLPPTSHPDAIHSNIPRLLRTLPCLRQRWHLPRARPRCWERAAEAGPRWRSSPASPFPLPPQPLLPYLASSVPESFAAPPSFPPAHLADRLTLLDGGTPPSSLSVASGGVRHGVEELWRSAPLLSLLGKHHVVALSLSSTRRRRPWRSSPRLHPQARELRRRRRMRCGACSVLLEWCGSVGDLAAATTSVSLCGTARSARRRGKAGGKNPVRLAYQPLASSTFLSQQTNYQQSASSTFLSEQISTNHQPPAK
jgi:hypothetical protein